MIGIYIHIPYCRTICPYCDFVKRRIDGSAPDQFVDALCAEITAFEGPRQACSLFFGGGTPSLLNAVQWQRILGALAAQFIFADGIEITAEANPDDVTEDMARMWRDAGINRISLGVQSFHDETLRYLGRRHDAAQARVACECVQHVFSNWSLDLIFGAHPIETLPHTLAVVQALAPPHLSAYGLTYEPGTAFGKRAHEAIDDDAYRMLYDSLDEGVPHLRRYEVSNFAQPGSECRHNLIYWHNEEYAGFGPGAYSFLNGVRARNCAKIDAYLDLPGQKEESLALTSAEIRLETIIQHLRLTAGLPKQYYATRFGRTVRDDFGARLDRLLQRGLLSESGDAIQPTPLGFVLNNEIGLELVN